MCASGTALAFVSVYFTDVNIKEMVSKCHCKCLQLEKNNRFSEKNLTILTASNLGPLLVMPLKIFLNDLLTFLGVIKLNLIMILKTISDI